MKAKYLIGAVWAAMMSTAIYAQNNVGELLLSGKNENYLDNRVKCNDETANCKVKFFTNFESGSLDSASLKNMALVTAQMQPSHEKYSFDLFSKFDPENPANPQLQPSARWYFFLMTGVKDKEIILNMHNSDTRRPFYSYNGKDYVLRVKPGGTGSLETTTLNVGDYQEGWDLFKNEETEEEGSEE